MARLEKPTQLAATCGCGAGWSRKRTVAWGALLRGACVYTEIKLVAELPETESELDIAAFALFNGTSNGPRPLIKGTQVTLSYDQRGREIAQTKVAKEGRGGC